MPPIGIATSRSQRPQPSKLWLLLVGVNKYSDPNLCDLDFAADDCQELAEVLKATSASVATSEVFIHHDLGDSLPTLSSLIESLKRIVTEAKAEDTILFYFSGHGFLDQMQQVVLCLADTQLDRLQDTGLKMTALLEWLEQCRAIQQLLLLDACHAGALRQKLEPVNPAFSLVQLLQKQAQARRGLYAVVSCDASERSWEFPELKHGVFTYFLIEGLRGEAADMHGIVDVDGLYKYVYHQTLRYLDKTNQQLRLLNKQRQKSTEPRSYLEYSTQTPKRIVEGAGQIILGRIAVAEQNQAIRQAFVINGTAQQSPLISLGRMLASYGGFSVDYWPQPNQPHANIHQILEHWMGWESGQRYQTLLYLRGRIEVTPEGNLNLHIDGNPCLGIHWLKQQLLKIQATKHLLILDWIVDKTATPAVLSWLKELRAMLSVGQCLIAGISATKVNQFSEAITSILESSVLTGGLTAADFIYQLQETLVSTDVILETWIGPRKGIIDIFPQRVDARIRLEICPYMGLRAFSEEAAPYFCGRDSLVVHLIDKLVQQSLVIVAGASGSGKSSVVQAGVMAAIRTGQQIPGSQHWWVRKIQPGEQPLEALAEVMLDDVTQTERKNHQLYLKTLLTLGADGFVRWLRARPEPMIVLVIDQMEELFTLNSSTQGILFLELILKALDYAGDRFKVIATLRVDFIESALSISLLQKKFEAAVVFMPPSLNLEEYREVILKPANTVGLSVEPELVEVLLKDIDCASGELALLEFVLEQLWDHRSKSQMTLRAYREMIGGVEGALERKADEIYASLGSTAKDCARWLFISLTQLGEGTQDTRRRLRKSELVVPKYSLSLIDQTVKAFSDGRLIVIKTLSTIEQSQIADHPVEDHDLETTIEVAHEVLIRSWPTLREWLEENRARLRIQRQIEKSARLWSQEGERPESLLRGARLSEAEELYLTHISELSPNVQKFVEASLAEQRHQQQVQKRRLQQARFIALGMGILAFSALGFGALAFSQTQSAQRNEVEALNASSEGLWVTHQPLESLVASTKAALKLQKTLGISSELELQTENTLRQALSNVQEFNRLEGHSHSQWVTCTAISPDGKLFATASSDQTIKLWKSNGTLIRTLRGHNDQINSAAFSADGNLLATASSDNTVKLWKSDGTLIRTLFGHARGVYSVAISPDSRHLATASSDRTIKLWTVDGTLLKTLRGHANEVLAVDFNADGQTLVSGSADNTVRLWRIDGTLINTLRGHQDWVKSVSFSPDGKTLASASLDKTIRLWNRAGKLLRTLPGHENYVMSVRFSSDGRTLATGSYDRTARLWRTDGTLLQILYGHRKEVTDVHFSRDGQTLATASLDNTVRLWHLNAPLQQSLRGHGFGILNVQYKPDGQFLATGFVDGVVQLWKSDGTLQKTFQAHNDSILDLDYSPNGKLIATTSADSTVKLWKTNGDAALTLHCHKSRATAVRFSPDGQFLATGFVDGFVQLWKSDGTLLNTFDAHNDSILDLDYSPDGKLIATASADSNIRLWKQNGSPLSTLRGHRDRVTSVRFSPDGQILATSSYDNTGKLWSADGRLLRSLNGHQDWVNAITFSPDGQTLATASADRTIKLWSLDGRLLKTFEGHGDRVTGVRFSPDGRTLASAGMDMQVLLWKDWNLPLDSLISQSCTWLQDYLKTNASVENQNRQLCTDVLSSSNKSRLKW
jgi:WD40 repeat protein/uncharacterized caspase-like protein